MILSAIVPVYNERDTIQDLLNTLIKVPIAKEIIIVDDGSTDGTRELLQKYWSKRSGVSLHFHTKNKGKGRAIRTGLKHVSGDVIIIQDADLEYDPFDCVKIMKAFENPMVTVVYGSRFLRIRKRDYILNWISNRFFGGKHHIKKFHHFFGVQFLTVLTNLLYGSRLTDEATCYKAFRADLIEKLRLHCRGFEFCPEITAKILKRGHKILELPVSYVPRTLAEGKKINWIHGLEAAWILLKYRFVE